LKRAAGINKKFFLKEKMTMKNTRKLIPAIAMLVVSAVMLTTASYAWFTMSTQATAEGMKVKAVASSSLLIVDATEAPELTDFKSADGSVEFTVENPTSLEPAARVENELKTVLNTNQIDPSTGFIMAGKDAEGNDYAYNYGPAQPNTNYVDYKVAIGAAGASVSGDLVATVSGTVAKTLHNALSIDFLVANNKTDAATYVASINLLTAKAGGEAAKVDLENRTIPLTFTDNGEAISDTGYIVIIMRVYFDGALPNADDNNTAYVRNANMTTADIGFNVTFDLVGASTPEA
jgi:hypothetical protein